MERIGKWKTHPINSLSQQKAKNSLCALKKHFHSKFPVLQQPWSPQARPFNRLLMPPCLNFSLVS
jgi:hypothetical protein